MFRAKLDVISLASFFPKDFVFSQDIPGTNTLPDQSKATEYANNLIANYSSLVEPYAVQLGFDNYKSHFVLYHDSEHSYENIMFEFEWAYNHLNTSGILASDDVDWNQAFSDFAQKHKDMRPIFNVEVFPSLMKEGTGYKAIEDVRVSMNQYGGLFHAWHVADDSQQMRRLT